MPFVPAAESAAPAPAPAVPVAAPEPAAAPPAAPAPSQSAQWAALTRKEAAAVAKLQEASAERAAAAADKAEAIRLRQESTDWAAEFKKDPIGTLGKAGLTYSQLVEIAMNDGKIPAEQQVAQLRQEMSGWQKTQADAVAKAAQDRVDAETAASQAALVAAEQGLLDNIAQVTSSVELFPLINQFKTQQLVYATIDHNFKETGKVLSTEEAAKLVEAHHRKQVEEAYAKLPKPPPVAPPQASRFQSKPQAPALTNRVAAPSTSSARQSNSVDDRIKAARLKYGF